VLDTIPKGRSITHNIFDNQNAVFLSFDIETAGEIAGIVKISAEIVRFKIYSAKVVCFLIKSDIGQKQWKQYLDHHSGRHDFQIDLALSVMNYGIGLQWDGESDERPNFMRQNHFVPCNCNKCFFCLSGITTGIAHPPTKKAKITVDYKCGTPVTTNKCTDVQVSLGMQSGIYCHMCYRKQLTTELSAKERKKTCRTSAMGCAICKESICKECWKEGSDKHA
jgi:hypothetical protein